MEDLGAAAARLLAKLDERTRQNKQRVDLFGNTCSHLPSTTRQAMDEGRPNIALVGEPQPRSMAESGKDAAGGNSAQTIGLNLMSLITRPPCCGSDESEDRAGNRSPATLHSLKLVWVNESRHVRRSKSV